MDTRNAPNVERQFASKAPVCCCSTSGLVSALASTEFIAGVGNDGVFRQQLLGDLPCVRLSARFT